jgi:hypothetical protein
VRVTIILDPHLPDLLFVPPNRPQSELCIHRIALYVHNRLNACGGPQVDQAEATEGVGTGELQAEAPGGEPEVSVIFEGWLSMLRDMPSIRFRQSDESNLGEFPRLGMKKGITACFTKVAREKPQTTYDNGLPDFGLKFVEGYHAAATGPDLIANAPFEN